MRIKETKILRRGQSTLELVVLFLVITAAFLLMQRYLKRAAMGKFKESAQQISQGQFDPLAIDKVSSYQFQNTIFTENSYADGSTVTTKTHEYVLANSYANIEEISNYTALDMDAF